jgi:hypothetical protein
VLNSVTCAVARKWGSGGTGDGQFDHPAGIALDATGNIYVADRRNYRIQVFDTQNNFVRKWGSAGTGDGQFSPASASGSGGPTAIAVDPWGNVYVADPGNPGNNRIQVFSTTGQFLGKFGSTGSADGQFFVDNGVATDAAGNIYVADTFNNRIQKFTAKEAITVVNRVSPADDPGRFDLKVNATTVKAGAGELDQGSTTVPRGSDVTVSAVAVAGTNQADYNTTIDCGAGPQAGTSLTLPTVTADTACTVINGRPGAPPPPPPPGPPTGTTDAADTVTSSGATLKGTANPNGGTVSTCRFDYGATTSYGQTVACSTTPAGSSATAVSAAVSGLSANTTYHYRLVVITNTGTLTADDASFQTALTAEPPGGSTEAATDVGSSSATLNATVNPQNESVSDCHFDYGATIDYGQSVDCASTPSGSAPVKVSASVNGLTPASEYHYRLVVSTSVAPRLETADQSFTTLPSAPVALSAGASGVTTGGATLHGSVDPKGFATQYAFQFGTTSSYGSSTPAADAGTAAGAVDRASVLTGLSPSSVYHYRIVALRSGHAAATGADVTFTTLSVITQPPMTPPFPTPAMPPAAPPATPPSVGALPRTLTLSKAGTGRYAFVATPAGATGTIAFKAIKKRKVKAFTVARASFAVPASGHVRVRVKPAKQTLKKLRTLRKTSTRVTIVIAGKTFTGTLKLIAPKARR